jgi:hypothetical protein
MVKLNFSGAQERRVNDLEKEQMPGAEWSQIYTEDPVPGPVINESRYKCSVELHIALRCDSAVTFCFYRDFSELAFPARDADISGDEEPGDGGEVEAVGNIVHIEASLDVAGKRSSDFSKWAGGSDN